MLLRPAMLTLSPYFLIRLDDPLCCDLPLDGRRIELRDPRYVEFISSLHAPAAEADVIACAAQIFAMREEEAGAIVDDLVREGILVNAEQVDARTSAIAHWERRGWLDALTLHGRSRNIPYDDDQAADPGAVHDRLFARASELEPPPAFWKEYLDVPRMRLPAPAPLPPDRSFEQILLSRRSNRPWRGQALPLAQLATILRVANQETRRLRMTAEAEWRTSPRALLRSAFSALESYVFAFDVEGLNGGIYHYDPQNAALSQIRDGLFRSELTTMCAGQQRPGQAACVVAITAVFGRYMYRYRHPRAYRTLLINVAELAQKYILLATAFRLSTFLTPLFADEVADTLLGLNGYEEALLEVVAIG